MSQLKSRLLLLMLLALYGAACVDIKTEHRDWSQYDGPGAEYFHQEEVPFVEMARDPGEPTNRAMAGFNYGLLYGVMQPIGAGWRFVFRDWGTTRLKNFATNLAWPVRLLNNMFQGKWGGAWDETKRFGVNTTVGVLGFWDRATDWNMVKSTEDTGQSLGKAGWTDPTFLHLPVVGPSSTRDGVGWVGDTLMNPATYFFPLSLIFHVNDGSRTVRKALRFTRTQQDPYTMSRYLSSIYRAYKVVDFAYTPDPDSTAVETLQTVFLAPKNPGFPWAVKNDSVLIPTTGKDLGYTYRIQDEPAPVVFILPGLGGHREGDGPLALAEMVWDRGFSFAIISSSMNFDFMRHASTAELPGYPPKDVPDVHFALNEVWNDLQDKHADTITGKALMGLSLGAFHTLAIASREMRPEVDLIGFDRYVALDAPIDLMIGMRELDQFYNAPLVWPEAERYVRIRNVIWKAMDLAQSADLKPGESMPFSNIEAEYLVGLSFRFTVSFIIFDTQTRHNRGVLKTELSNWQTAPAYREIVQYSFMEYFYAFMLPWLQETEPDIKTDQDVFDRVNLRMVGEYLAMNDRVHLVANENDFLTTPEDREWITKTLDGRVTFNLQGGHIGNLWKPEIQDEAMRPLMALLPATPTAE